MQPSTPQRRPVPIHLESVVTTNFRRRRQSRLSAQGRIPVYGSLPTPALQSGGDPRASVIWVFHGDLLDIALEIQIVFPRFGLRIATEETARLTCPRSHVRNTAVSWPSSSGFACAGRSRSSSQYLQHPLLFEFPQAPLQKSISTACHPTLRSK